MRAGVVLVDGEGMVLGEFFIRAVWMIFLVSIMEVLNRVDITSYLYFYDTTDKSTGTVDI